MSGTQTDNAKRSDFQTLIVDAWCEASDVSDEVIWRFRVRDVRTGKHYTFATLSALLDHLNGKFGANIANS